MFSDRKICKSAALILSATLLATACGADAEELSEYDPSPSLSESVSSEYTYATTEEKSETTAKSTAASESAASDSETVIVPEAASSETEEDLGAPTVSDTTEATVIAESAAETTTETVYSADMDVEELSLEAAPERILENASTALTSAETAADNSADTAVAANMSYDKSFFENTLFIGDSITTGYSLYGYLDERNVYAKIGLNPSTVLTKSVSTCYGEITIGTMLDYTQPDIIYIMLGSNGIQWLSCENMIVSTGSLVEIIKEHCPNSFIVLVSVPPVTADYDSTVDIDVMEKILEYNSDLWDYAYDNVLGYIDITELLTDETGYFNKSYAEYDGMHFKPDAYKIVLSELQSVTEDYIYETGMTFADEAETDAVSEEAAETEAASDTDTVTETINTEAVTETEAVTDLSETGEDK